MNDLGKRLAFRVIRIVLIVLLLLVGMVVLHPERFLPPGMTLGDFFQGLLGALFRRERRALGNHTHGLISKLHDASPVWLRAINAG